VSATKQNNAQKRPRATHLPFDLLEEFAIMLAPLSQLISSDQHLPIINSKLNRELGGTGWIYFIFAALALLSFLFVSWRVPETRGKKDADEVWGRTRRVDWLMNWIVTMGRLEVKGTAGDTSSWIPVSLTDISTCWLPPFTASANRSFQSLIEPSFELF